MAKENCVKISKKHVEIHEMVVNLALNLSARILEEETEAMFQGRHEEVSEERVKILNQHTRALSGALALISSVSVHFLSEEDEASTSAVTAALLAFAVGSDEYMDKTINDESSTTFKDLVNRCMKKVNPEMCDKLKTIDSIRDKMNEAKKIADELETDLETKRKETQKTKKESKPKKESESKQKKTTTKTKKTSKKEE